MSFFLNQRFFLFENEDSQENVAEKRNACSHDRNDCNCIYTFCFGDVAGAYGNAVICGSFYAGIFFPDPPIAILADKRSQAIFCLLYTSDAADDGTLV